jgi:hypothetical protein
MPIVMEDPKGSSVGFAGWTTVFSLMKSCEHPTAVRGQALGLKVNGDMEHASLCAWPHSCLGTLNAIFAVDSLV